MKRTTTAILLALLTADAAACTAILGVTDIPPEPDAGTSSATTSSSGSASSSGSSSGGGDGGCTTIYVSESGDNKNDGCSPEAPVATISHALQIAESKGPGYTIWVCGGMYTESDLKISVPGSLLGSFDCSSVPWKRAEDYGYPQFKSLNASHILNGDPTTAPTLTVTAPAGNEPLLVDGFTIHGTGATPSSTAVLFGGGTGTLSNCNVLGGSPVGSVQMYQSRAIRVNGPSAVPPVIFNNRIQIGTTNDSTSQGAAGINLSSQAARIDTNKIVTTNGTPSPSPGGSFGIWITNGATDPTVQETIAAGAPIVGNTITSDLGQPSVGIQLAGPIVADIVGNTVYTSASPATGSGNGSSTEEVSAIYANALGSAAHATVRILGNALYGGGSSSSSFGDFDGVHLLSITDAVIVNNLIYGGFRSAATTEPGSAYAIRLDGCTSPIVADNTLFTGFPGTGGKARAVFFATNSGKETTGARVQDNILAGGGVADFGLGLDTGCKTELAALENNLFIGFNGGTAIAPSTCNDAGPSAAHDVAGVGPIVSPAAFSGNVIMTADCSAADVDAGSCISNPACAWVDGGADSSPCLEALFPKWGTSGYTGWEAWEKEQWAPAAVSGLCQVLRGGEDLSDAGHPVTNDFFDAGRGSPPTIGAVEVPTDASTCK